MYIMQFTEKTWFGKKWNDSFTAAYQQMQGKIQDSIPTLIIIKLFIAT